MAEASGGGNQAPAKTVKAIKYTGSSDVRQITKAQMGKAGVDDQDKVVWSAENDFTVKESDLSKKALALIEKQPDFKQVEVEA
jgi:hypothetical protein